MKHPWFKFWPSDWLGDTQLRLCSQEARGLLIDCLAIMHEAKRRGYLETKTGKAIDDEMLSRLIGTFKGDVYRCKAELIEAGVVSVDDNGVIYSRRMVKESEKSAKCAKAGRKGGGNPAISREEKEIEESICHIPDAIGAKVPFNSTFKGDVYTSEFLEFWNAYPKKKGKGAAFASWKRAKKKADAETIINAVNSQKTWEDWTKDDGQYIPNPATWLNQCRWEDAEKVERPKKPWEID